MKENIYKKLVNFLTADSSEKTISLTIIRIMVGSCYVIAFVSLMSQFNGLYSDTGLYPLKNTLHLLHKQDVSWFQLPHLFISESNFFYWALLWIGLIASIGLMIGVVPGLSAVLSWAIYLSVVNLGGLFMSFQWDILLLEIGFLLIITLPFQKKWVSKMTISKAVEWAWYLCF